MQGALQGGRHVGRFQRQEPSNFSQSDKSFPIQRKFWTVQLSNSFSGETPSGGRCPRRSNARALATRNRSRFSGSEGASVGHYGKARARASSLRTLRKLAPARLLQRPPFQLPKLDVAGSTPVARSLKSRSETPRHFKRCAAEGSLGGSSPPGVSESLWRRMRSGR